VYLAGLTCRSLILAANLVFFTRYYYDYAAIHDSIMIRARKRFNVSDPLKHGMLSTAVLFRSNYERSNLATSLCIYAEGVYLLATRALRVDLERNHLSPWVKLGDLIELIDHEVSYMRKGSG
jgi:hypothetical protein